MLSARSAQTLAAHYHRSLTESNDRVLYTTLRGLLVNVHTPAILRLELGRLLQMFQELDPQLLESLLDQANSAPLRLIACESILNSANNTESSLHPRAINTLKDLARLPNREIALAAADVVQRRLGVDLGMGIGQPLPAVQSRQAADITRRVMQWAIQFNDDENLEDSRPQSQPRPAVTSCSGLKPGTSLQVPGSLRIDAASTLTPLGSPTLPLDPPTHADYRPTGSLRNHGLLSLSYLHFLRRKAVFP